MNRPEKIIIHCSATKEGRDFTAADIDRWHRARGFLRIGYHYVVRLDGTVEPGRAESETGAHCPQQGMNRRSVSICYIGGLDSCGTPKDTRTSGQKRSILALIASIRSRHGHLPVCGHRDIPGVAKACPCFSAIAEYASV
ncbi:MAG: N-acetylmuramoyl-L-alanine amidase [Bacteroides sp.]|nr:N-acetylmuramoyl-L-alanine amidase [Bacteroides sp.]